VKFFTGFFLFWVLLVFFIFASESESYELDEVDYSYCSNICIRYSCL